MEKIEAQNQRTENLLKEKGQILEQRKKLKS